MLNHLTEQSLFETTCILIGARFYASILSLTGPLKRVCKLVFFGGIVK